MEDSNLKKLRWVCICMVSWNSVAYAQDAYSLGNNILPLGVGIWPGLQIGNSKDSICGVSIGIPYASYNNLYGLGLSLGSSSCEDSMYGVDVSLFQSYAMDSFVGIQASLISCWCESLAGIQMSGFGTHAENGFGIQLSPVTSGLALSGIQVGFVNIMNSSLDGLQVGGANIVLFQTLSGVQIGGINVTSECFYGIQFGAVNLNGFILDGTLDSSETAYGGQIGIFNFAFQLKGGQIGFINYSEYLHGIQLGLVNRAKNGNGIQIGLANFFGCETCRFMPIINWKF